MYLPIARTLENASWLTATLAPAPTIEAARYPQVVALAQILWSPALRELPFTPATVSRFVDEVRRTVAPTFTGPPPATTVTTTRRLSGGERAGFLGESVRRRRRAPVCPSESGSAIARHITETW